MNNLVKAPIFKLHSVRNISEMYEALHHIPYEYVGVSACLSFDINQHTEEVVLPANFIYKKFTIDVFEGDIISSIKLCTSDGFSVEHERTGEYPYTFEVPRWGSAVIDEQEQMVLKINYKTDSGVSFRRVHVNVTLIKPEFRKAIQIMRTQM